MPDILVSDSLVLLINHPGYMQEEVIGVAVVTEIIGECIYFMYEGEELHALLDDVCSDDDGGYYLNVLHVLEDLL